MIIGRFFQVSEDSSHLKGDIKFQYFKYFEKTESKNYPIILSFQRDRVEFRLHTTPSAYSLDKTNTLLFSLEYYEEGKINNGLNNTLTWIQNNDYVLPKGSKSLIRNSKFNQFNYHMLLNEWGYHSIEGETNKISFRELFIDFLFDFNLTEVFKRCPNYKRAKNKLLLNFYFEAICAKFCYNYQYLSVEQTFDLKNISYVQARKNWMSILLQPKADEFIYKKNEKGDVNWFLDIEDELLILSKNQTCSHEEKKAFAHWLTNRNALISAIKVILTGKNKRLQLIYVIIFMLILSIIFLGIRTDLTSNIFLNFILFINRFFIGIVLAVFSICLIHFEKKSTKIDKVYIKYKRPRLYIKESFGIIAFKLIIVFTTTWFFISESNYLLDWCFEEGRALWWFSAILILIALVLVLNNENETRRNTLFWKKTVPKSILLFFIALFYGLNICIFFGSANMRSMLVESGNLNNILKETLVVNQIRTGYSYYSVESLVPENELNEIKNVYLKNNSYILTEIQKNTILQESAKKKHFYFLEKSLEQYEVNLIKQILEVEKPLNRETEYLFNMLKHLKKVDGEKLLISGEIFMPFRDNIHVYILPRLVIGQLALLLFVGVFAQIIIQRKPLAQ